MLQITEQKRWVDGEIAIEMAVFAVASCRLVSVQLWQPFVGFLMKRSKTHRIALRASVLRLVCRSCALLLSLVVGGLAIGAPPVFNDWRDEVGYPELVWFLGDSLPNGAGVPISLVEAGSSGNFHPDTNHADFDTITDPLTTSVNFINGSSGVGSGVTTHSTSQARTIFGNTSSVAPAANIVTVYEANHYLDDILNTDGGNAVLPVAQDFRVQNFSWIGDFASDDEDREALRRFDYVIDTNNITAVVGLHNNTNPHPRLLSHSYNALAVGRTVGTHSTGLTNLPNYGLGRSKPDLVAPRTTTSAATSSVSSAATFLHSADTVLGTDATKSATMKAILMTGATKDEFPSWSQVDGGGTWHPLDETYGAGELNLYNSYLVTLGGRNSGDTLTPTFVGNYGWDYQTVQPGDENRVLYEFVIPSGSHAEELSIVLTWNAKIKTVPGNEGPEPIFDAHDPIVANLNLELFDEENNVVKAVSASDVDNVEHLYLTDLAAGAYTLKISSEDLSPADPGSALASDFGVAWRTSTLFDTFSADFNGDGDTNGSDFLTWQRGYKTLVNATLADGDTDGDGDVDEVDLAFLQVAMAGGPMPSGAFSSLTAVPEPATWFLACAALLLLASLRNRRSLGSFSP